MKIYKVIAITAFFTAVFFLADSCSKVPITNRRQLNMLPESQLMSMSLTSYQDFLSQNKVLTSSKNPDVAMVKTLGENISKAVEKYLKDNKQSKRIEGFQWEFNLVDDPTVNAWCMPGGKVVVYTGLLQVTKTEAGLAVVMGHEVAHAIARHGNERMSQQMAIQLGGIGLAVAMNEKPEATQNIFMQAYGVGSTLGSLKYSRNHESEADKLGLVFMAMAGYNPEEAIGFWERMAAASGNEPPEITSTHPSNETRINDLKEFMPEALKYYKK